MILIFLGGGGCYGGGVGGEGCLQFKQQLITLTLVMDVGKAIVNDFCCDRDTPHPPFSPTPDQLLVFTPDQDLN